MIATLAISLAGFVVLTVAGALAYRAVCQHRTARSLVIRTPNGIAESRYVRIGGMDQWIQIRGEDRANPVLLFLHGSGMSMIPFTPVFRSWEQYFTVVQWDRRGVGQTLSRNGRAGSDQWTFDLMASDGIEIAEYLCRHLGQDKVIVLGHSQGTIVGLAMARQRPDLFRAYVGTGQIVDLARNEPVSYQLAVARAQASGRRKAARELARLGAPPYPRPRMWIIKQRWSFDTDPELQLLVEEGAPHGAHRTGHEPVRRLPVQCRDHVLPAAPVRRRRCPGPPSSRAPGSASRSTCCTATPISTRLPAWSRTITHGRGSGQEPRAATRRRPLCRPDAARRVPGRTPFLRRRGGQRRVVGYLPAR